MRNFAGNRFFLHQIWSPLTQYLLLLHSKIRNPKLRYKIRSKCVSAQISLRNIMGIIIFIKNDHLMLKQRKSDLLSPESPFVLSSEMISRRIKIRLQRPIRPYEPMDLINGCILSAEINPKSTKLFTGDRVVQRSMFTGVVSRSPGRATTKKESKMRSFDKRRQKSCYTKGGSLHSQTKYILERSIFRKMF